MTKQQKQLKTTRTQLQQEMAKWFAQVDSCTAANNAEGRAAAIKKLDMLARQVDQIDWMLSR